MENKKEITVLDGVFKYTDGFKGATGSIFEPVSKEQYDEACEEENLIEHLMDSGIELPDTYKRGGFKELAEAMINSDEVEQFMFDTSYSELWDYLREATGLDENEAYIFNCVGGGRCFDADFQGNMNEELSKVIREYEAK